MPTSTVSFTVAGTRLPALPGLDGATGRQVSVLVVVTPALPGRDTDGLAGCLAALEAQTVTPDRVVVADGVGAAALNAALGAHLPYVADAGAVLLLDTAVSLAPDFVAAALKQLDADPDLGVVVRPGAARATMVRVRTLRDVVTARSAGALPGPMEVFDSDAADPELEFLLACTSLGWGLDTPGGVRQARRRALLSRAAALQRLATSLAQSLRSEHAAGPVPAPGLTRGRLREARPPVLACALIVLTLACAAYLVHTLTVASARGVPFLWP